MMQNALTSSGGLQAWQALRSAKSQYSSPGPQGKTVSVLLLDDWTSRNVRYRRGVLHSGTPPTDHDSHAKFTVTTKAHTVEVPEFDQARVLADHLPSAAIEVMLRSNEYIFRQIPADHCSSGNTCAAVYRQTVSKGPFLKEQEWDFSTSTGLPVAVKLRLPDVLRNTEEIWEQITFGNYAPNSNCLIPTVLNVVLPDGRSQIRNLDFIQQAVPFDVEAFDQELRHE